MTILQDFVGTKCSTCSHTKAPNQSFCRRCYGKLPHAMKHALYKRMGEGYEQSFTEAQRFLRDREPQRRFPQ